MRILHIDDDEDLRNVVSRYIRDYWPDAHIDGYDPLERDLPSASFPLRSYDLIVLDYMLGRGDGLEWLKALKQRDDCPKILFLTGAGNETIAVRAIKAGADDYQPWSLGQPCWPAAKYEAPAPLYRRLRDPFRLADSSSTHSRLPRAGRACGRISPVARAGQALELRSDLFNAVAA
jgi:CheY-like chemotaxis protein